MGENDMIPGIIRRFAPQLALVILVIGIYGPGLGGPFIYDDITFVVNNPIVRSLPDALSSFGNPAAIDSGDFTTHVFRPVVPVVYAAIHSIFGMNPVGFHLFNLIIHACAAILLYLLILEFVPNKTAAFFASAWWAVHPALVEAVEWISGMEDVLCGALVLGGLLLCRKNKPLPALLFFLPAILVKETALAALLVLPFLFIDFDEGFGKNLHRGIRASLPFAAMIAVYFLLRWQIVGVAAVGHHWGETLTVRLFTMAKPFFVYIRLAFFPFHLQAQYFFTVENSINFYFIFAITILLGLAGLALYLMRKKSPASLGLLWFFLFLLPVANILPFQSFMNERFLYLPIGGIALVFAVVLSKIRISGKVLALLVLIMAAMFAFSLVRVQVWLDEEVFLWDVTTKVPEIPGYQRALGELYLHRGELDQAEEVYRKMSERWPGSHDAGLALSGILRKKGDTAQAQALLMEVLSQHPSSIAAAAQLADLYLEMKIYEKAKNLLVQLVQADPDNAQFKEKLALAQSLSGSSLSTKKKGGE